MEVELTPEQEAFVRQAIETGRLHRPEEAVREALSLWEERERSRVELLVAFDEAEADLEAGHYTDYTNETLPQLADELKREARSMRDSTRAPDGLLSPHQTLPPRCTQYLAPYCRGQRTGSRPLH